MLRTWLTMLAVLAGIGFVSAADLSSPLFSEPKWNQAKNDLAQGRAAEAKAAFEELLKRYPDEPDLHLFRGMALLRLRDPHRAILEARKAIELNPRHVDARTFLAWIELEVRGDADAAIGEYQRIIELHPELPAAYSNLAVAQKRKGNFDQALASLNKALELKPDFAAALTARGGIFAEQGRWAEARRDFERALRLDPGDDGALYGLSQAMRETRDYAAAQRALGELISRSPNFVYWLEWGRVGLIRYWWILVSVALALSLKGRFRKARTANG
ncbi:MAG TPA: tetratricopeptide repeat protein [Candidatus Binatia bacterium]|nr:tetratricopeptide repeat protein [Candidatus Binatia bacterium]